MADKVVHLSVGPNSVLELSCDLPSTNALPHKRSELVR